MRFLTEADKEYLREQRVTGNNAMISAVTGIPRTTIRDFYAREDAAVGTTNEAAEALKPTTRIRKDILPLSIEVRPPVLAESSMSGTITALLYGDIHFPHQNDEALSIVQQIAFMLQPDLLVNMGDMLDCTSLSRFDKDPAALETIQDEIDMARAHLAQMRQLLPQSRMVLLEGNHSDRLRRTLWGLKGEASVLNKLTKFQELMTWPALLDLENLGVEFVPYGQQSKFDFLPKFILKHGDTVRGYSAYTARGEMEKYNFSGASGHTHRLGQYFRRDRNGAHVWIETGCCCSLTPQYVADPNWQNGCVVLTFERETGAVHAELVNIVNGMAVWRGNVLRA